MLRLARRDALKAAGVSVDIALNGTALTSLTGAAGDELSYAFEPGIGLNIFKFTWKKDGAELENESLRFHVVR